MRTLGHRARNFTRRACVGGFLVALTSRTKPWTLAVSTTALKDHASGVVLSSRWIRDVTGCRNEAADLHTAGLGAKPLTALGWQRRPAAPCAGPPSPRLRLRELALALQRQADGASSKSGSSARATASAGQTPPSPGWVSGAPRPAAPGKGSKISRPGGPTRPLLTSGESQPRYSWLDPQCWVEKPRRQTRGLQLLRVGVAGSRAATAPGQQRTRATRAAPSRALAGWRGAGWVSGAERTDLVPFVAPGLRTFCAPRPRARAGEETNSAPIVARALRHPRASRFHLACWGEGGAAWCTGSGVGRTCQALALSYRSSANAALPESLAWTRGSAPLVCSRHNPAPLLFSGPAISRIPEKECTGVCGPVLPGKPVKQARTARMQAHLSPPPKVFEFPQEHLSQQQMQPLPEATQNSPCAILLGNRRICP
nr:uncharacterized protein LOC123573107 [Macaca fascicularis]